MNQRLPFITQSIKYRLFPLKTESLTSTSIRRPASSEGLFVIEIQMPAFLLQQQNQQENLRDLCAFAVQFFLCLTIINLQS